MAIESLIGGGGTPGGGTPGGGTPGGGTPGGGPPDVLPPQAIEVLDHYMGDTVEDSISVEFFGDTQVISGTGSDGESQAAVISGDVAAAGEVDDGVMTLSFSLPANMSFILEGFGNQDFSTPEEIKALFDERLEEELPGANTDPEIIAVRDSIAKAIDNLTAALAAQGVSSSVIRIVDFSSLVNSNNNEPDFNSLVLTSNATTDQIITLDVSGSANNEVFALLLNKLNPDNSLELKGIESAILIGSGTVFVGDNNDVNLQGDTADQHITGGGGNDTLVGGGGNDTLIGGAGTDIIGITELGHYTVELDLNDKLAFQIDNVSSIDDLVAILTDVTETNGNVTYEFLDGHASITLVGVTASEVTENLVQFNL